MILSRFRAPAFALGCFVSCAAIATSQSPNVRKDISYVTGTHAQSGDLYEPAGSGPFPAILYIHGGSWRSGNKGDFRKLATDLAAKGYAGFSIDYDLEPKSYPLSWQQAEAAVRFLRNHAAEYHIDPMRIAVVGTSAGGEIAALLALDPEGPAHPSPDITNNSATSDKVEAAVMLNSVYDLTGHYGVIKRYLGGDCADVHEACLESSPMEHIHPGAPPFFVGHGTSDHTVPFASAELFTKDMKAAGNAVTFFKADGGPHMYFTKKKYYADNLAAVEAFLAANIGAARR
jgi:acetyl esterase/lipase